MAFLSPRTARLLKLGLDGSPCSSKASVRGAGPRRRTRQRHKFSFVGPSSGSAGGRAGDRLEGQDAQHHHRHERQGRRGQVDACPGARRDAGQRPRQEDPRDRLRCPGQHQPHAAAPRPAGGRPDRRAYARRLSHRGSPQAVAGQMAGVPGQRRIRRRRCALDRPAAERHAPHPVRAGGVQAGARAAAARRGGRPARRRAAALRSGPDRQRAGPFGAHRVLAARGRLLPLPDAARLHLHARAQVPAPVPRARPAHGLCRAAGRHHQHEGRRIRPRMPTTRNG